MKTRWQKLRKVALWGMILVYGGLGIAGAFMCLLGPPPPACVPTASASWLGIMGMAVAGVILVLTNAVQAIAGTWTVEEIEEP